MLLPNATRRLVSDALSWYSRRLESHPLATKGLTSGFIAGSGDALCQYIVHHRGGEVGKDGDDDGRRATRSSGEDRASSFGLDVARTSRFAFLGTVLIAPMVHHWYAFLMRRFPGKSISATLRRTFWDQTVCAPLFIPTFMTSLMLLEGKDLGDVRPKLEADFWDTLVTNWCMWVPAQLINFGFVPSRFQVLFSNFVGLVWNTYFSYKASGAAEVEQTCGAKAVNATRQQGDQTVEEEEEEGALALENGMVPPPKSSDACGLRKPHSRRRLSATVECER